MSLLCFGWLFGRLPENSDEDVKTKFKQRLNVEENTCLVNFFLQNMTKVADCGFFLVSFLKKYLFKLSIPIIFVAERVGKKVQP